MPFRDAGIQSRLCKTLQRVRPDPKPDCGYSESSCLLCALVKAGQEPSKSGLSAATKPVQEQAAEEEALLPGASGFPLMAAPATLLLWGGNPQLVAQVGGS